MTPTKEQASLGGRSRASKLTPEQRSESARKAAAARWAGKTWKRHFDALYAEVQKRSTTTVHLRRLDDLHGWLDE
jgi:hypothetical protein